MKELVQVRPCKDAEDNQVVQCCASDANYFSVYYGPASWLVWIADFRHMQDAINWAEEVAENNECNLDCSLCES